MENDIRTVSYALWASSIAKHFQSKAHRNHYAIISFPAPNGVAKSRIFTGKRGAYRLRKISSQKKIIDSRSDLMIII